MYAERYEVQATTAADGTATAFSPVVTGRVLYVGYVKAASDSFADGVDFSIKAEGTGQIIWAENDVDAAKGVYPLVAASLTTGAASTLTEVPIVLANDRVEIGVASGGNGKVGSFVIVVG